jgi:hypothetical protein
MCIDKNKNIIIEKVHDMLKLINRPFIYEIYKKSLNSKNEDSIGTYIKNISMPQYKYLYWKDSIFEPEHKERQEYSNKSMILKWGNHDEPQDYDILEDFYIKMKTANAIETPQEEVYLKKLAVMSLKMDKALENEEYGKFKQLGDLFSKFMADSKFRAMDKTDADLTGGVRNFSAIYAEVEKDDFIPPWDSHYAKIYDAKQDIVDKTIMYILNFILKLNKIKTLSEPPEDTPQEDDDF